MYQHQAELISLTFCLSRKTQQTHKKQPPIVLVSPRKKKKKKKKKKRSERDYQKCITALLNALLFKNAKKYTP